MSPRLIPSLVVAALALSAAQSRAVQPPSGAATGRLVLAQIHADAAYGQHDYARALSLYLDPLAAAGDKHAQYMIGVMHLNGQGVSSDPVKGAAWMKLAAERGDRTLAEARDAALASLSTQQRTDAHAQFLTLLTRHGDCSVVKTALDNSLATRRALRTARGRHGGDRRTQLVSTPVTVIYSNHARHPDTTQIADDIRARQRFLRHNCAGATARPERKNGGAMQSMSE